VLQAPNAAMDEQERDAKSGDVTAVTSAVEDRFAQRRTDALTTLAETTIYNWPSSSSTLRATRKHSSDCGTPQ
jgi:hypothetical protein